MSYREWGNIIFLSHFDYPYYGEPNTGLRDEVTNSNTLWHPVGNVTFAGHEFPVEEELTDTSIPKWGYRCVHLSANAKLELSVNNVINAIKSQHGELSFMLRMNSTSSGPILELKANNTVIISIANSGGTINLNGGVNKWLYVLMRFEDKLTVYVDGQQKGICNYPSNYGEISLISIGGSDIYVDEFRVSDALGDIAVPPAPYQARINLNRLGGYGDGHNGNYTIASLYIQINSYAQVTGITNGTRLTIANTSWGKYGMPSIGDEVMLHVVEATDGVWSELGKYEFCKIRNISSSVLELDSVLQELDLVNILKQYKVQVISVPNLRTLTIRENCTLVPCSYANGRGGLVVLRVSEECELYGGIYTTGYGPLRTDLYQMTHGELIDRIILNNGGGVMLFAQEITALNITANGFHSTLGGQRVLSEKGAGYGGGEDRGGVGGGGGWDIKAGVGGNTGGRCAYCSAKGSTQGIDAGGNTPHPHSGAGAGGYAYDAASGANVILITPVSGKLDSFANILQTGGNSSMCGSGTGFCYIGG